MHQLWPVTIPLARGAAIVEGARVLDVGCGTGEPALAFAQLVGPNGRVLAVDVSPAMVKLAAARARRLAIGNVRFRHAGIADVRGTFDAVSARFSLMFVPDVPDALGRLRARLRRGGRAAFAVWGPLARNVWLKLVAEQTEAAGVPPPDPAAGPHPMRFGRRGSLEALLRAAGYRDIRTEPVAVEAVIPTAEIYAREVFETSSSLRAATRGLPRATRQRIERRIARSGARHVTDDAVRLPGLAWVVSGRR